jgi:hypothetical protein
MVNPNPTINVVCASTNDEPFTDWHAEVRNILGEKFNVDVSLFHNSGFIQTTSPPSGSYIVSITSGSKNISIPFRISR